MQQTTTACESTSAINARRSARALCCGKYRVGRRIGAGGMGEVYEALDQRSGRLVALKCLAPHFVCNPTHKRRFEREAAVLARLDHPHIVRVVDASDAADGVLATELLMGVTLRQHVANEGTLSVDEAARLAEQALSALGRAHAAGVIHRDVKPDNLFLEPETGVKLIDFGIAKERFAAAITATGQRLGTPTYMAPEQQDGRDVDARTDLYALGGVLYFAIVGVSPIDEARLERGTAARIAEVRPDVCPRFVRIIERALSLEPRERFDSADAMRAEIEAWRARRVPSNPALDARRGTQIVSGGIKVREHLDCVGALMIPLVSAPNAAPKQARAGRKASSKEVWLRWAAPLLVLGAIALWSTNIALFITSKSAKSATARTTMSARPPATPAAPSAVAPAKSALPVFTLPSSSPRELTVRELVAQRRAEFAAADGANDATLTLQSARRLAASLDGLEPTEQAADRGLLHDAGTRFATRGDCQRAIELLDLADPERAGRHAPEVARFPRCAPPVHRGSRSPDLLPVHF